MKNLVFIVPLFLIGCETGYVETVVKENVTDNGCKAVTITDMDVVSSYTINPLTMLKVNGDFYLIKSLVSFNGKSEVCDDKYIKSRDGEYRKIE